MKGRIHRNFALITIMLLAAACQTRPPHFAGFLPEPTNAVSSSVTLSSVNLTNHINPAWLQPSADLFTVGPGDKLEIEVLGEAGSRATTIVAPDGKLYYNLLPGIDVWGSTLAQVKAKLEDGLGQFVRERPQVSLVLRGVESRRVWVLGRVQVPGVYPMAAPMSLLEAVSMAGGTLSLSQFQQQEAAGASGELADFRRSFVMRDGKPLPVDFQRLLLQGDMSQNIYLQPDDFVYLAPGSAKEIYVLGAVAQPRAVPFRPGMTVAMAVASAYGTINGAYMHHVVVVRGSLSSPQAAVIDYRNVLKGQAQDIALEPRDIVYVPFAPYRYLVKYVELAINTFVSSAAINAGVKAVGVQQTGGAGVFIPVGSGVSIIPPVSPPPIR